MIENSFYIETYGCTSNKADSLIISDVLIKVNLVQTSLENAQFIIINTCAVKEQTEKKIKDRLKKIHELYQDELERHVIIAGCLPHIDTTYIDLIKKIIPSFSAIIDLDNLNELPDMIQSIKKGNRNQVFLTQKSIDKAKFFVDHSSGKITGITPISEGCLGSCTYCCVKNARGRLNCYDPMNIIGNIHHQLKQGIKQIYLTSQDCSTYQYDGTKLVDVVKEAVNLNYEFFLRIGMVNPSFLINDIDQLITIFKMDKVYQFLHVPIQSASTEILKKMQRTYTIPDIIDQLEEIREEFPYLTISTDIICGFPGETEYDFHRTVNFIKWLKPEIINISKFTPRPNTKAKEMKQLDSRIIKDRSNRLSKVFRNSLSTLNKKWEGWEGKVLTLHEGSEVHQGFGRNFAYKNIYFNNYNKKFGEFINVKVVKVDGFNLFAEII